MKQRLLFFLLLLLAATLPLHAQYREEMEEKWRRLRESFKELPRIRPSYIRTTEKEILSAFDRQPSFGLYKDNYFTTGIPLHENINKYSADVKFQISVRQRLTKAVLPFNTFLVLTYTQKSFWDIYAKSAPFKDNNYNPSLALIKPVIRNSQLWGVVSIALEHESNGKDSLQSRGWNYFALSGVYFFNQSLTAQVKLWAGVLDRGETPEPNDGGNPDLYHYRGYGLIVLNYHHHNDKLWLSAIINPTSRFGTINTQVELNFKFHPLANQYLFVQWYNGYGESLLNYNRYSSMLRVGICIKPPLRNVY